KKFFFSSRRRHTRFSRDWSSDVCSSDLQVVVSGATAAVERAVEIAKGKGAKRALLLPVSAPFHCSLMQPAADAMAAALAEVEMRSEERRVGKERRTIPTQAQDALRASAT